LFHLAPGISTATCITAFDEGLDFHRRPAKAVGDAICDMATWTPIITTGPIADRAREAVDDICTSLLTRDYVLPPPADAVYRRFDWSLLCAYLGLSKSSPEWTERSIQALADASEDESAFRTALGLHTGICGFGWTYDHLVKSLVSNLSQGDGSLAMETAEDDSDEDICDSVDEFLIRAIERAGAAAKYDLLNGLVGFGIYFLERGQSSRARFGVCLVIDKLESLAEWTGQGVTWMSRPSLLSEWFRSRCPNGLYNLGVAHGIPAVMYFLGEAMAAGVEVPRTRQLLEGAMTWFLAHRRPTDSLSHFPGYIPVIRPPLVLLSANGGLGSRLGWCYGDLGIVAVLFQLGRRAGRHDWLAIAEEILADCLRRRARESSVCDMTLCHGATGIAHIYNRIYNNEGKLECREAALEWFDLALSLRKPGIGVGGVLTKMIVGQPRQIEWCPNPGFLNGAIGVALSLLAALTPVAPQWDRRLALSGIAKAGSI
jgi:hypothetical protein